MNSEQFNYRTKTTQLANVSGLCGVTDNGNSGSTATIDWTDGVIEKITLTANCALTFTAPTEACTLGLQVVQDGTGNRTITWPANVKWTNKTEPTLTTDADALDIISFLYDGTNYNGVSNPNFG